MSRLFLTPFVVAFLGFEAYAFWTLSFVLLGWVGLQRSGFLSAAVPLVSDAFSRGDLDSASRTLKAAATLSFMLSCLAFGIAAFTVDPFLNALGVPDSMTESATRSFLITVAVTGSVLTLGGFQSCLEACNQFPRVKAVETGLAMAESVIILVFLTSGWGLEGMAAAYAMRVLGQVACYFILARQFIPRLSILPGFLPWREFRPLLKFGASLQSIGFLHLSIAALERLLIVHYLGLGTAGIVELARKLVTFSSGFVAQGLGPIASASARFGLEDGEALSRFLLRSFRLTVFFGVVPLIWLAAVPELVLMAWLKEVPPDAVHALRILALASFFHLCTGPWTAGWRGQARTRFEMAYASMWLVLLAISIPLGFQIYREVGILLAVAGSQFVASLFLLVCAGYEHCRRGFALIRATAFPLLIAAAPALALSFTYGQVTPGMGRWSAFGRVASGGFICALIFALFSWPWFLSPGDRRRLLRLLKRLGPLNSKSRTERKELVS